MSKIRESAKGQYCSATTVKISNSFELIRGGEGMEFWIQNRCLYCGWVGQKHYAHNDYQHSNCREERERHSLNVCVNE